MEGTMGLYSHYDGAHNHPVNRALHMIAIPVGFSSLIVVEGNKPAFLTNPAHVFVAPLWMARKIFGTRPEKAA
jgi:uncharacterized membrane protein YGL010W